MKLANKTIDLGVKQMANEVNDSNFTSKVTESSKLVIVDFWAEWCGPCRALAPVLDTISVDHKDKVELLKLNIDDNPETAQLYSVRSIPTLVFLKDGKEVKRTVGLTPKAKLEELINDLTK